ncbi:Chromodomain-helicase-DNA-binding protein 1-like, partial [Dissostichus eleginoides]
QRLLEDQEEVQRGGEGRALRHKAGVSLTAALGMPVRKRKALSEEELQLRRKRREEAADGVVAVEQLQIPLPAVYSDSSAIRYVLGDVTHPQAAQGDAIIVHCVDDSGRWGRGGLFTALEVRSDEPRKHYELAGKMKDLDLGNVLLFPLALIVAQQRDGSNQLSAIFLSALDEGLKKIYAAAKRLKASVHLPRIGHATRGFNWYGTERLIRKHLSSRGVHTFIYYHSRAKSSAPSSSSPDSTRVTDDAETSAPSTPSTSSSDPQQPDSTRVTEDAESSGPAALPDFMKGVRVFFYNLPASERKRLARYLCQRSLAKITYDGDEEEVMSPEVTHIVAEVESSVQSQELQELQSRYPQAVLVQKLWMESCFCKQSRVNTAMWSLSAGGAGLQPQSEEPSAPSVKIRPLSHGEDFKHIHLRQLSRFHLNTPEEDDETMSSEDPNPHPVSPHRDPNPHLVSSHQDPNPHPHLDHDPHPVSSHRNPNPHPHLDHDPHPVSFHWDHTPHPVSSHRDPNPHPHRDHTPHPVSSHRDPNPHPHRDIPLTLSPPIGTQTLTPIGTITLTLSPAIGTQTLTLSPPIGTLTLTQRQDLKHSLPPAGFCCYQPPGYSLSQPTPFSSQTAPPAAWLHPSFSSSWSGGYPSSGSSPAESFLSGYKLVSSSLEQPLSLCSNPPSGNLFHHTLSPYSCAPPGAACFAQLPPDAFRGPKPWPPPQHPAYNPYYPDAGRLPGAGFSHIDYMAPAKQKQPHSTPLSLEQRRVFVTYEADNDKHVNEIINFVALLRHNGFDTHIDIFEQQFRSISKIDFMERYLSEKEYLIIIIISPKYYETVTSSVGGLESDERTFNTVYIHKQLQNEFIQNGSKNFRFIPIVFPGAKKCHVPNWLQNTHVYEWPLHRDDILRRLMRIEKYNPPQIGSLPTIVSIPI